MRRSRAGGADGRAAGFPAVAVARRVRRVHAQPTARRRHHCRRCRHRWRIPRNVDGDRAQATRTVARCGRARGEERRVRRERPQRLLRHDRDRPRVRDRCDDAGQVVLAARPSVHGAGGRPSRCVRRRGGAPLRQDPAGLLAGRDRAELRRAPEEAGRADELPRFRRHRVARRRRGSQARRLRALPGCDVGAPPGAARSRPPGAGGEATCHGAGRTRVRGHPGARHRGAEQRRRQVPAPDTRRSGHRRQAGVRDERVLARVRGAGAPPGSRRSPT